MAPLLPNGVEGTRINDAYEIQTVLGAGGGGEVFRATQRSTGQHVAIKFLRGRPQLDGAARRRRRARFRREMEICAALHHPGIIRLIDFGAIDEDQLYSVFELVEGPTLADHLAREGSLALEPGLALMSDVLDTLAYAHDAGVVHRDLKPHNLMVVGEGPRARIKVLDFGISSVVGPGWLGADMARLTLSGEVLGTPAYAAPEQVRGGPPTSATDLYAWGLVTLECLTGRNPQRGSSAADVFARQLAPTPVELPRALEAHPLGKLLCWTLAKHPRERASDAREVLTRLADIAIDELGDHAGYLRERVLVARHEVATLAGAELTSAANPRAVEAELRPLVMLTCRVDVEPDPEVDVEVPATLLDAYRADLVALAHELLSGFDAVVLGALGGTILACFGLPAARDTDARQAASAALELGTAILQRDEVLARQSQVRASATIGLHAGVWRRVAGQQGVLAHGELAAAALGLADQARAPGEAAILASAAFRARGDRWLLFAEAETEAAVHRLVGEAAQDLTLAPLVGRARELERLYAAFDGRARGRVVLVRGGPGIGKSRLCHELRQSLSSTGGPELRIEFGPADVHRPLAPLVAIVRHELGLDANDDAGRAERRLRAACEGELAPTLAALTLAPAVAVSLLGAWLRLPDCVPPPYSPHKQRALVLALITSLVVERAAARRSYVVIEDLHWADPSSLEWLTGLVAQVTGPGGPGGFVLLTARPELEAAWDGVEQIELGPLDGDAVAELARALVDDEAEVEAVVARADGIPLFAEELCRVLRDRTSSAIAATTEQPAASVPTSLEALLVSRLDALRPTQRELAQLGSVFGREFDLDLLALVSNRPRSELAAALDPLLSAEVLHLRRELGQLCYRFRHALVHQATYATLPRADAEALHRDIADLIVANFPERVRAQPELVADHEQRGARPIAARDRWLEAAQLAAAQQGFDESVAHAERGLGLVPSCDDGSSGLDAQLDLLVTRGSATLAKYGYGAPAVLDSFTRAAALADHNPAAAPLLVFAARKGLWSYYNVRPEFPRALALGRQLETMADAIPEPLLRLGASGSLAQTTYCMARFERAIDHARICDSVYDRGQHGMLAVTAGEDPRLASMTYECLALVALGRVAAARERNEQALAFARELGFPHQLAGALGQSAWMHVHLGLDLEHDSRARADLARAQRDAGEAMTVASEHGFPFWQAYGVLCDAAAQIVLDRELEAAVANIRAGIELWRGAGAGLGRSWQLGFCAKGLARLGRHEAAITAVDEALAHVEASGEHNFSVELRRLEAAIVAPLDRARAEDALRQGARLARSQHAALAGLRVARDAVALLPDDPTITAELEYWQASC